MRTPASGTPAHDPQKLDVHILYAQLRRDFSRLAGAIGAARIVIDHGDLDAGADVLALAEDFACNVIVAHNEQSGGQS